MINEALLQNKRTKRADMLVLEDTLYTHRKETLVASDRVNATVFGLQSNTVHYAQICVRNGQHDGPLSVPISFRLPEGGNALFLLSSHLIIEMKYWHMIQKSR